MITAKGSDEPIGMIEVAAYTDGAPEIGFSRIVIGVNVENSASNRVIEKGGFIFTHRESKERCSPFKPEPITVNWYEIKNKPQSRFRCD